MDREIILSLLTTLKTAQADMSTVVNKKMAIRIGRLMAIVSETLLPSIVCDSPILEWLKYRNMLNVTALALSDPTRATVPSSTMIWMRQRERKMANAQIKSNLKCGSGRTRYIFSRAEFRYHIVMGFSSFGGPKMSKHEQVFSGGRRFDSIMAMLCEWWERSSRIANDGN